MSDDLRRILNDPAHRLPDDLVDLAAVHRTARARQRRRVSVAAGSAALVVAAFGVLAVHPWQDQRAPHVPDASALVTPPPTSPPAPSPSPSSPAPVAITGSVLSVTALSSDSWWVLETAQTQQELGGTSVAGHVVLLRTTDAGSTFSVVSRTSDQDGIPAGTTDVRFMGHGLGYALRAHAEPGDQVWQTVDGGRTWIHLDFAIRPGFAQQVVALEAGGGTGWLLVQDGRRIGVAALDPGLFENPRPIVWLGSGNGVRPALTVQGGNALVFWFTDSASRLSVVATDGTVRERRNPCTPDVGVGSVSATESGLAVSCHLGTTDAAYGSADGGRTWAVAPTEGGGRLVVGSINAGFMAIGGQDGQLTLAASDVTRPLATTGADGTGAWTWIGFTTQTSGFAIDEAGQLFHTDQRGTSWTKVSAG